MIRDTSAGVELSLALACLGGEVPHQVFVGIAEQVVALSLVCAEVETVENRHQLREAVLHLFSRAELALVVEVGLIDDALEVVCLSQPADDRVDLVTNFLVAFQLHHIGETTVRGHFDERTGLASVFVRDVLHEQQRQNVVLVLGGIHAAAQLVAALPE